MEPEPALREPRLSWRPLLPFLAVAALVGWCWSPILQLGFTGEDYVILERLAHGGPAWLHVFRPLPGAWLGLLHRLLGVESAVPYHAGTLLLHLLDTTLVYLLALELFGSRWSAATAAALFGLSAGATDSLAWIASVNRPWSAAGALVALLGLARLPKGVGPALTLVVLGFLVQAFSNEEVYGMTPLLVGWLLWSAWRMPSARKPILACAVLMLVEITAQFLFLQRVPAGAPDLDVASFSRATGTIAARAAQMARGLGLDASLGPWIPVAGVLLLFAARRRTAAALAGLAWVASLIPFALSTPSSYRAYPTLAPTALLLGGGAFALVELIVRGRARVTLSLPVFAVLLVAIAFASQGLRRTRIERWYAALAETRACARDARRLAQTDPAPPVLVNLALSSAGPFYYYFRIGDPEGLRMIGFLDAASCFEEPGERPPGRWYGRRLDGTYGLIEPERYLTRPVVEPLRLYSRARRVSSLAEARSLMSDPTVDLLREALAEAPAVALAPLEGGGDVPAGTLTVLSPFEHDQRSGHMTVRVDAERTVLLAYQEHWLYEFLYRVPPDQAVITDTTEVRRVRMTARMRASGEEIPTFHVNAFGLGCLVPPGEHEIELRFSRR